SIAEGEVRRLVSPPDGNSRITARGCPLHIRWAVRVAGGEAGAESHRRSHWARARYEPTFSFSFEWNQRHREAIVVGRGSLGAHARAHPHRSARPERTRDRWQPQSTARDRTRQSRRTALGFFEFLDAGRGGERDTVATFFHDQVWSESRRASRAPSV